MALGKDERKEKIFGVLYPGGLGLLGTYLVLCWSSYKLGSNMD